MQNFFVIICFISIRHFHISHNAPYYGTQNFSEALLSISLGMALIPRKKLKSKIKQNFGGANKVHYGKCVSGA